VKPEETNKKEQIRRAARQADGGAYIYLLIEKLILRSGELFSQVREYFFRYITSLNCCTGLQVIFFLT
jgi:hypothetical protein